MRQYQELIKEVLRDGEWQDNRTGIPSISIPGAHMRFNLEDGFPAVTTKKLAFKSVIGELCAFMRGYSSAADFRALGCKVWDQNANDPGKEGSPNAWLMNAFRQGEDDLGPIYGVQWREWAGYKLIDATPRMKSHMNSSAYNRHQALLAKLVDDGWKKIGSTHPVPDSYGSDIYYKQIDQLANCVNTIIHDPQNRRILFHAWNPAELDAVSLPACHLLYQFFANKKTRKLSMSLYVRSNDIGLGTPFNIAEGAALLSLVARLTGYTPHLFNYFIGDAHIYENHIDMVNEVLAREPHPLPELKINERVGACMVDGHRLLPADWLSFVEPSDFELLNYVHHDPISAPMAV